MEVKQAKQIMNFSHFDTDFLFHDTMGKKGTQSESMQTHVARNWLLIQCLAPSLANSPSPPFKHVLKFRFFLFIIFPSIFKSIRLNRIFARWKKKHTHDI